MSVLSGRAISRTGSYEAFPVVGTALTAIGLGLLSRIDASTPSWLLALFLFLVGGGLGLTIQPLLVAVQSAVEPSDLGVATSANVFFRSFGSTVGTAMFAAIFAGRLGANLEHALATLTASGRGALASVDARSLMANAERIKTLPIELQDSVLQGFAGAFQAVFLVAVSIALVGTVVALFVVQRPRQIGATRGLFREGLQTPPSRTCAEFSPAPSQRSAQSADRVAAGVPPVGAKATRANYLRPPALLSFNRRRMTFAVGSAR
jgi:hypothetical protein